MWFPRTAILGFAAQLPFLLRPSLKAPSHPMTTISEFRLKTGNGRFTPKDLIELSRPGAGTANTAGDLVLAPVSEYSFADKK
jgi:hypothetical protein